MAIEFFSSIDVNQNDIHFPVIHKVSSAPSSPTAVTGQMYYNTSANTLHYYNGSWQTVGTSSASGDLTGITAGVGLSGSSLTGPVPVLTVDFSEFSTVTPTNGDFLATLDSDGSTEQKTSLANLATLFAGSGLTATNSVIAVDTLNQNTTGSAATLTTTRAFQTDLASTSSANFNGSAANTHGVTGTLAVGNGGTGVTSMTNLKNALDDETWSFANNTTLAGFVLDGNTITGVDDSGEFTNDDAHIMTSAGVEDKILGYSYITASSSDTLSNKTIAASQVTEISNITAAEGAQIENIGSTTISATQWGYLGAASGAITNTDADVSVANLKTALVAGFGSNAVTIGDSDDVVTIGKDLIVTGDLTVSGDTITASVGTLDVEDKNITLNKSAGDSSGTADGAGITIQDAVDASNDATILWTASSDTFTFSHAINANVTGNVTGNASGSSGSCTGAAATVTSIGNLTGDVTSSNRATTIGDAKVTLAKQANLAQSTIIGRAAGAGTGVPTALTASQIRTLINVADDSKGDQSKSDIDGLSITTVGTLDTGNATAIVDAASDTAAGKVELASATEVKNGSGAGKVVDASQIGARSVTATIVVGSMSTNKRVMIEHGLNTQNVMVQMWDVSTYMTVYADVYRADDDISTADVNAVTIDFGAVTPPNNIEVLITSLKGATDIGAGGSIVYT